MRDWGCGKQDGCFGPNNTILVVGRETVQASGRALKALDPQNMANDAFHGPGSGNEIVKVEKGAERVASDITQGSGDIAKGAGDALKGVADTVKKPLDAVGKVLPHCC